MAEKEPLDVYLNDHLAGSAAGVELVERLRANNQGTALAAHLEGLGREIQAEKDVLADMMERLGVAPSTVKQAGGKVLETLSRLRLNERITGSAHVSKLMEIEALSLGIEGKLALWRSLSQVTASRPELATFDLPGLMERAVRQRDGLEPYRLEAATEALGRSPSAS